MKKLLMILAVCALAVPVQAEVGHIALDLSGVWGRSFDPSTPPNQSNFQAAVMYKLGQVWVGGQGCTQENGDVTGGAIAEYRTPWGIKNKEGHQWLTFGATGWYDFNNKAFGVEEGAAGGLLIIDPIPDNRVELKLAFLADGYRNVISQLVDVTDGPAASEHESVSVQEDKGVAFGLRFGVSIMLD